MEILDRRRTDFFDYFAFVAALAGLLILLMGLLVFNSFELISSR